MKSGELGSITEKNRLLRCCMYKFQVIGKMVPLLQNSNYSNQKLCPNMVKFPVTVV